MGAVGGQISHILQIDDHAESRQYGRNNDRDNPCPLHVDTGVLGNLHILPDRPHILSEFRSAEPDNQKAHQRNHDQGGDRDPDALDIDRQEFIQLLTHLQKTYGIADAVASGELDRRMDDRNNRTHQVQNNQLIDTIDKIAHDIAGYHLSSLCLIQDLSAEHAQRDRNRN